jgi:hypothetical protein
MVAPASVSLNLTARIQCRPYCCSTQEHKYQFFTEGQKLFPKRRPESKIIKN